MSIERLRALADWCNDRQVHWAAQEGDYAQGRVNAFCEAEYEIRQSIAELGQEVGAVEPVGYMDPDADFMLPRKGQCVLSSHVVLVRDPHGKYTRPIYLSPAHTSEARDAARYRALKTHFQAKFHRATCDYWVIVGELKTDPRFIGEDGEQLTLDNALDAAIAAMRQEGGTP